MPFIKQRSDVNNCGAMCLCYLEWLEEGRTPEQGPKPTDEERINTVYDAVAVKEAAVPGLPPDYCDPVKMIRQLQASHTAEVSFYLSEKSLLKYLLEAMRQPGKPDSAAIEELDKAGRLRREAPPVPKEKGQAAIAVYNVSIAEAKTLLGQHYLLFREDKEGKLACYNPWFGVGERVGGYETFTRGPYVLSPAEAAILIG